MLLKAEGIWCGFHVTVRSRLQAWSGCDTDESLEVRCTKQQQLVAEVVLHVCLRTCVLY